jgi:hypothetical protein
MGCLTRQLVLERFSDSLESFLAVLLPHLHFFPSRTLYGIQAEQPQAF